MINIAIGIVVLLLSMGIVLFGIAIVETFKHTDTKGE